jgi:SAM-dependent methyltransferase
MAFDSYRNELYAQAIRNVVTPDSVVLDLGAGIGILGLIAAAAGAKRVYLVEPQPIVKIASKIAKNNGLDDKIVILNEKIEDVELPEKVDLIISVFTGNLLFTEDLLPSLYHARDAYLKPNGKLIPDKAELYFEPVFAPAYYRNHIGRWSTPNQGLDFSPCRSLACNEIHWPDRKDFSYSVLADVSAITSADFEKENIVSCRDSITCKARKSEDCHGLLGWIRVHLFDQWLSSSPNSQAVHWSPAFLPIERPLALKIDDTIKISVQRPQDGDWTWSISTDKVHRKHSTFLSRLDTPRQLVKLSAQYAPKLNKKGLTDLHILKMIQHGLTNQEIAQSLAEEFSDIFPTIEAAMTKVQTLVRYYST